MEREGVIRLALFVGVLVVMGLWEVVAPRRERTSSKGRRWLGNFGLVVVGTLAVRVLFPVAAVGTAIFAREHGWGLFNTLPAGIWSFVASFILLDLIIYLQHVMFHAVPLLWRLHMVHHGDKDLDVSSGLRFHPIEIVLSMLLKIGAVAALGPPPVAVLVFEVVLNAAAMFNHGNVRMPLAIDRVLRLFVVTPDMHRVHHSISVQESNSNFGFNLPWWDRLLGTYKAQPDAGHLDMTIGLTQFQNANTGSLTWLLVTPFVGDAGGYAINRRSFGKSKPDDS